MQLKSESGSLPGPSAIYGSGESSDQKSFYENCQKFSNFPLCSAIFGLFPRIVWLPSAVIMIKNPPALSGESREWIVIACFSGSSG